MNTKFNKFALAIGILATGGGALAAQSATSSATATVITPVNIVNNTALIFGSVSQTNGTAGTVVVSPAGARSVTGGALIPAGGTAGAAATFTVTGESTYAYTITLPSTDVTLSGPTDSSMIANAFTVGQGAVGTVTGTTGNLVGGTGNLNVGATLNMVASQVSGTYTGSFPVTVAYN